MIPPQQSGGLPAMPAALPAVAVVAPRRPTPHNCPAFDSKADDLLTAEQVAAVLKIRPKEVYTLALPAVRLSARRLRWTRSSLDQFISSKTERR